jgi:DNA-binding GntR family transcriptional regulator
MGYGVRLERGLLTIRAGTATEEEARLLGYEQPAAVMLYELVAFVRDGTAIEYTESIGRSDRHQWTVPLFSEPADHLPPLESIRKFSDAEVGDGRR